MQALWVYPQNAGVVFFIINLISFVKVALFLFLWLLNLVVGVAMGGGCGLL